MKHPYLSRLRRRVASWLGMTKTDPEHLSLAELAAVELAKAEQVWMKATSDAWQLGRQYAIDSAAQAEADAAAERARARNTMAARKAQFARWRQANQLQLGAKPRIDVWPDATKPARPAQHLVVSGT